MSWHAQRQRRQKEDNHQCREDKKGQEHEKGGHVLLQRPRSQACLQFLAEMIECESLKDRSGCVAGALRDDF